MEVKKIMGTKGQEKIVIKIEKIEKINFFIKIE